MVSDEAKPLNICRYMCRIKYRSHGTKQNCITKKRQKRSLIHTWHTTYGHLLPKLSTLSSFRSYTPLPKQPTVQDQLGKENQSQFFIITNHILKLFPPDPSTHSIKSKCKWFIVFLSVEINTRCPACSFTVS